MTDTTSPSQSSGSFQSPMQPVQTTQEAALGQEVSKSPKKMTIPAGGSFNTNEFARMMNLPSSENDKEESEEVEETTEEESDEIDTKDTDGDTKKSASDSEEETDEEEGAEEASEEGDLEIDQLEVKGKGFRAKTADGKDVKLPEDLTIYKKVDGEWQEIALKDALNREVGERTIEQRMSALANKENSYRQKIQKYENKEAADKEFYGEIQKLAASEKPELVFAKLAERTGQSPGQIYRNLFNQSLAWADTFAKKLAGKGEAQAMAEMDNYFNRLDLEWMKSQNEEKERSAREAAEQERFLGYANESLQKYGVSEAEFEEFSKALVEEGAFKGRNLEDCVDLVCATVLQGKHHKLIESAIEDVDPSIFKKMPDLKAKLVQHTDLSWTPEDVKTLVREYKKDQMTAKLQSKTLATKPGASSRQNIEVKQKSKGPVKVDSLSGLNKLFGVRS